MYQLQRQGNVVTVFLAEDFSFENVEKLQPSLLKQVEDGAKVFDFDLSKIKAFDHDVSNMIFSVGRKLQILHGNGNFNVVISNPSPEACSSIVLSRFYKAFTVAYDSAAA